MPKIRNSFSSNYIDFNTVCPPNGDCVISASPLPFTAWDCLDEPLEAFKKSRISVCGPTLNAGNQ